MRTVQDSTGRLVSAIAVSVLLAVVPTAAAAQQSRAIDLFNGKDLTGWVNVNCAPTTWTVREGMIVCSGQPRGPLALQNHGDAIEFRNLFIKELK